MTISTQCLVRKMTSSCTTSVFPKYKNSSIFLDNKINMFSSTYSKILHEPECLDHCCSESVGQPMQVDNFNDLMQYPNFTARYSDERISTSTNYQNQSLYDLNPANEQVPEFEAVLNRSKEKKCEMMQMGSDYETPINNTRYVSCSMSVNPSEARYKQRSYCKGVTKRKRRRTVFSTEQIIVMEGVFKKRPYVSREEKLILSQRLNISEKAIKIWFQNRRRVTEKRDRDQSDSYNSDSTVEEVCNDYNTRLDYIESQLYRNTDEYGFVTLDNKSLSELVKVIDNVLSQSIDCHNYLYENKNNESYLMYEPVSPEGLPDDNKESENILEWTPSKPEESLQRLIDIQTVLYS